MKTLYLNPSSGIAGDMLNAALLDLGADTDAYWTALRSLPLPADEWSAKLEPVKRGGLAAKQFIVEFKEHHDHHHGRHLSEILGIIAKSDLPEKAKENAAATFKCLADAEAQAHDTTPEKVHFHEVGAVDAIIDICGACLAVELLGIDRVVSTPPALGSGTVRCAHGTMPVPVPAVSRLLEGIPVSTGVVATELTTPTGAALLRTLVDEFVPSASGVVAATGFGAGGKEFEGMANVLQAILMDSGGSGTDQVTVLECNIDDMPGERLTYIIPKLLEAGAVDAIAIPCLMKKGRQGMLLQVLAPPDKRSAVTAVLLRETTTFGVRYRTCSRSILDRKIIQVSTPHGTIDVKLGFDPESGELLQVAPEYDSCAVAASKAGVPLDDVYAAAAYAGREQANA